VILHIKEAKYLEDYKIEVLFNDDRKGIADLSAALKGTVFQPLKNISEFATFRVDPELDTIVWPNGADLAPEYVYFLAFTNDTHLQAQFKSWGYIA
jgi:hypothetical protein